MEIGYSRILNRIFTSKIITSLEIVVQAVSGNKWFPSKLVFHARILFLQTHSKKLTPYYCTKIHTIDVF